jgi:phosphoribosyl-ATP pyrophosphohydrolase/phosphoribosyl-AMP cyclohydrolase/histidinol dehydrogenase
VLVITQQASITLFVSEAAPRQVRNITNLDAATYGYAKQYSGVNLASYVKHITSSHLTKEGLHNVGPAVMELARVEELEAHRRAVSLRLGVA